MVVGVDEYKVAVSGDGGGAGGVGEGVVSVGNPCDGCGGDGVEDRGVAACGAGWAEESELEDVPRGGYGGGVFEEDVGCDSVCF